MIHTHTMSQIKTVQEPLRLLKTSVTPAVTDNLNVVINTTPFTLNVPQSSTPVNTASCILIVNSTLSYLKLIPVVKSTVTSPNIKVTGWTKVVNSVGVITEWVPICLFASASMTIGSDAISVNTDGGFRRIVTITKAQGDAKIYNATNVNDTAFILVDTLGCELIEVEFNGGTAVTNGANAYYGAI